jgi:UDP-N-acetylglucosamine 4,6-dehydratase
MIEIKNKTIMITGGTGTFGYAFVKFLLLKQSAKKIIIFSRDEFKQYKMKEDFKSYKNSSILRYFIGDVRDLDRLKMATEEVDILIHAAAMKHVPIAEYNPFEAVKTNVIGAQNVIDACIYNKVKNIIALSTDKASSPINLYGATKLTSDKLFIAANNYVGNRKMRFSVVRYGNVFGSRGSVVPFFLSLKNSKYIPVTDLEMTRFSLTIEKGVSFVVNSLSRMVGGEIFVPKIPSYRIMDLIKALPLKKKIKVVGIRPGEKIFEELLSENESRNTIEEKNCYIILPSFENNDLKENQYKKYYNSLNKVKKIFSYNSRDNISFLNILEIKKLIETQKQ